MADGLSHALRLEMGNQCRNTTSVAHFSGSILSRICLRAQPLESSLGRVPQAADGTCKKNFVIRIVSVAEDCLSPERTFHGCSLMHFRGCFRGCFRACIRFAKLLL